MGFLLRRDLLAIPRLEWNVAMAADVVEVGGQMFGAILDSETGTPDDSLLHEMSDCAMHLPTSIRGFTRSEEPTSELPSLMRISSAVFCLKKKKTHNQIR